jgi:hypothetical protein
MSTLIVKKGFYTRSIFWVAVVCLATTATAQYTADKVMGPKNQGLADSLKKSEYPYLFPIWGKKVVAKGFNIPKSGGVSVQYLYQTSDIIIENLQVGFNHGEMYPLDQVIRFNSATATTNGVNFRPDIWLFPFLNIYGIYAQSKTSTAIDAGVWLPTDSAWKQVTNIKTKANFNGTTFGFGLTPTVGIRGYFLALDMNFSWTDIEELEKPAFAFVFGPRFGKNISMKKKDMSLALWVGGFRVEIGSSTSGSLNATDLLPLNEWKEKVNTGNAKVAENQQKVDNWWSGLSAAEQNNPVNIAKHETANRVLGRFGNVLDQASQIVANAGEGSVQYSLSKKQKQAWNFIVGGQFQLNRSWQLRAEYGFLGTRQQFIGGLQYRFNL